ncbi:MAG: alpha/beta hydrolase [Myxococcales bacterium]|nr:alpha/beta hydrolase [Myxococcales bacterium]
MNSAPFRQLPFDELPDRPRVPHRYFEAEARTVPVRSHHFGPIDIHCRVHGAGPPLLLVHGFMTSSYSWRYALEPLGRHFTCYAPDLPGAGRSTKPLEAPYEPEALAIWIAEFQEAAGIRGCAVIGNSLGGYLSMRLALRDPESMSRLVNVHSPGFPEPRLYAAKHVLGLPRMVELVAWLARRDPERWVQRNVHYYDETLKSREETREYGAPLATREGSLAFARMLVETVDPTAMGEFQTRLTALKESGAGFPVPLLLLYAERDPMVSATMGPRFAERIPDAKFVVVPESSHFMHVDAVPRFLPPVLEFLGVNEEG